MSATPGPWKACGRGIYAGDTDIALTTHPRDIEEHPEGKYPSYDESIANAALIAAAPDLLEGLVRVTASLAAAHSLLARGGKKAAPSDKMFAQMLQDYAAAIEFARATIIKATGRGAP